MTRLRYPCLGFLNHGMHGIAVQDVGEPKAGSERFVPSLHSVVKSSGSGASRQREVMAIGTITATHVSDFGPRNAQNAPNNGGEWPVTGGG
ncbi:MAG TPA: hypothetical protein VNR00_15620, partial [Opitutus sp.]|nr:hypothetical protein [Opitutus sp.]